MSEPCDPFKHRYTEEYYGYRCVHCGEFIPFGCEPWIDDDDTGPEDRGVEFD